MRLIRVRRLGWTRYKIVRNRARQTYKMSFTKNPTNPMTMNPRPVRVAILLNSLRSGLVHFLTRRYESLANSFTGLTAISATSMVSGALRREAGLGARRGSGRVTPTTTTRALASDERGRRRVDRGLFDAKKRARVASQFLFRSRRFRGAARGVGDPVSTRVQNSPRAGESDRGEHAAVASLFPNEACRKLSLFDAHARPYTTMKRSQLLLLALAAVFATASAEVFFEETFDGASAERSREPIVCHTSRRFPRNAEIARFPIEALSADLFLPSTSLRARDSRVARLLDRPLGGQRLEEGRGHGR